MRKSVVLGVLSWIITCSGAWAACSTYPYTLTNGTTADATQVMANFNCILGSPVFSGPVGIGSMSSASYPLEVIATGGGIVGSVGGTDNAPYSPSHYDGVDTFWVHNASTTPGTGSGIGFSMVGAGPGEIASIAGISTGSDYSTALVFQTRSSAGPDSEKMRITSTGNVGIGTTSPSALLAIGSYSSNFAAGAMMLTNAGATQNGLAIYDTWAGAGIADEIYFARNGGGVGSISTTLTSTTYNTGSDRRIKQDIVPTRTGLSTLLRIPVDDFRFKKDPAHALKQGFIAQDIHSLYPEAVVTNGDDGKAPLREGSSPWMVDYGRVTPLIVRSVQELNAKVDAQQREITTLLAANRQQESLVKLLEAKIALGKPNSGAPPICLRPPNARINVTNGSKLIRRKLGRA